MWDVVNSNEWANLKAESGDGGDTSMTDAFKEGIKKSTENKKKRSWWNNGVEEKHCEVMPNDGWTSGRLPRNNDHNSGRLYWNNGEISVMSKTKPNGDWVRGKIKYDNKNWWTNGVSNLYCADQPSVGWENGFHRKGQRWTDGKTVKMSESCPGAEWRIGSIPTVIGKKWWTNGETIVFQESCPSPDWWNGRK